MFWGISLEPGRSYTQIADQSYHVTMAALDLLSLKPEDRKPVSVFCIHNKARFLLCTLDPQRVWQQSLDLRFVCGEEVGFKLEGGTGQVHLTGHLDLIEEPGMGLDSLFDKEEMSDDLEESEEDDSDAPMLVTLGDDDEDDDEDDEDYLPVGVSKKRKRDTAKRKVLVSKRVKLNDLEDDNYDSENDSEEEDEDAADEDFDSDEDDFLEDDSSDEVRKPVTAPSKNTMAGKKGSAGKKGLPAKVSPQKTAQGAPGKKMPQTPKLSGASDAGNKSAKKNKNGQTPGALTPKSGLNTVKSNEAESSKKKKKKKRKKNKPAGGTPSVSAPHMPTPQQGQSSEHSPRVQQQLATPKTAHRQKKVLPGGTSVEDLRVGQGAEAQPGQTVCVYYRGLLSNGKQFDSKIEGKPLHFRLGRKEVIKGWDVGLQGMKVGGKRKLIVPPSQGYGNMRQGPIPPNSTLVFEVELKNVK